MPIVESEMRFGDDQPNRIEKSEQSNTCLNMDIGVPWYPDPFLLKKDKSWLSTHFCPIKIRQPIQNLPATTPRTKLSIQQLPASLPRVNCRYRIRYFGRWKSDCRGRWKSDCQSGFHPGCHCQHGILLWLPCSPGFSFTPEIRFPKFSFTAEIRL